MGVDVVSKSGEYFYYLVKCGNEYTKVQSLIGTPIRASKIGYSKSELDILYELGLPIAERRKDEYI